MPEKTQKNRVFILGAGFSKPAGFPLATELTDRVLDAFSKKGTRDHDLIELVKDIRRIHGWIENSSGTMRPLNIEELYEFISVYAERLRMEQHRVRVGRYDGETPYAHSRDCETYLTYLDDYLFDVLLTREQCAELQPIRKFTDSLHPGDTVVTFNYDRLVERCLTDAGRVWNFGFQDPIKGEISVLKMHGSIDWMRLRRGNSLPDFPVEQLYSKRDENRRNSDDEGEETGEHEYDWELYHIPKDDDLFGLADCKRFIQFDHGWALAGLGPNKKPNLIPGLGVIWEHARNKLFFADEITIVGFSFSTFDRLAQIEFARVMSGRSHCDRSNPVVRVIDPTFENRDGNIAESGKELKKRIETVFRPLELVGLRHEDYDW